MHDTNGFLRFTGCNWRKIAELCA